MELMVEKVIMFAIIIAISFISTKIGWINETVRGGLSRLIIKVTAPLMIFTSISNLGYDLSLIWESITIVAMALVCVTVLFYIGVVYAKAAKLDEKTKGVQVALMAFGNVAFLAYPLLEAVFGPIGVFYGAFYHLVNDTCFWSVGVAKIDYKGKQSKKERIAGIFSNNMIAIILGLVFFVLQIKLPPALFNPLAGLGGTTVYLSLVFVGATMATVDINKTYKKLSIYAIVFFKMLVIPVIVAFILTNIYSFGLTYEAICAVVLQISMPCMIIVSIMANELGGNYKYAAEAVFVTTVASLVTMPVMLFIIDKFMLIST